MRSIGFWRRAAHAARSRAFARVLTRSACSTTPSWMVMIGFTLSIVPIAARAPQMRPPRLRNSRVSRQR